MRSRQVVFFIACLVFLVTEARETAAQKGSSSSSSSRSSSSSKGSSSSSKGSSSSRKGSSSGVGKRTIILVPINPNPTIVIEPIVKPPVVKPPVVVTPPVVVNPVVPSPAVVVPSPIVVSPVAPSPAMVVPSPIVVNPVAPSPVIPPEVINPTPSVIQVPTPSPDAEIGPAPAPELPTPAPDAEIGPAPAPELPTPAPDAAIGPAPAIVGPLPPFPDTEIDNTDKESSTTADNVEGDGHPGDAASTNASKNGTSTEEKYLYGAGVVGAVALILAVLMGVLIRRRKRHLQKFELAFGNNPPSPEVLSLYSLSGSETSENFEPSLLGTPANVNGGSEDQTMLVSGESFITITPVLSDGEITTTPHSTDLSSISESDVSSFESSPGSSSSNGLSPHIRTTIRSNGSVAVI